MCGAEHQRLVAGKIRVMTFDNVKDDVGSSFADNIAGWVSEELGKQPDGLAFPMIGGSLGGEIVVKKPSAGSGPRLSHYLPQSASACGCLMQAL